MGGMLAKKSATNRGEVQSMLFVVVVFYVDEFLT